MDLYLDEEVDLIMSVAGGEIMCEILPFIDFDKIKNSKPKYFMGYSDNTNLTFTLTTICDLVSIYGACVTNYGTYDLDKSLMAYDLLDDVENKLMSLIEESKWHKAHHLLLFMGRYKCLAKNPKCSDCFYKENCKYDKKPLN